jgi:hypothetical protein
MLRFEKQDSTDEYLLVFELVDTDGEDVEERMNVKDIKSVW